ncbi:putative O-methyltransferase glim-like protein [Macrophomina phaseolina]|uniref:O-methyltransferase glim-like protein n=1 Tax=Macrophomina phaseolina TaxID=35725 RepID=A0ABQ8G8I4_9PEZI|nr:putative O-methyltransferase glim-like protein [Macrophomina phaseolina]
MEARLDNILASAKQAVQAFEGALARDVDVALSLSPESTSTQSGALRAKIEETRQTLHRLERIITPPQVLFMDATFAATNTKVLLCASHYRLADIVEQQGPLTVPALAAAAGLQPQAAHQLLRFLIDELGFFERSADDTVRNNRASALLRTDHPTTWQAWVDQYATTHYAMLARLPDAVAAGSTRTAAQHHFDTDEHMYALMQARGLTAGFHRALGAFSAAEAPGLLADYGWGDELAGGGATLTDIGAGQGDFVAHYLRALPQARAVAFDLPSTAELIRKRFAEGEEEAAVRDRVEVRAGDFFAPDNQLPASEAYVLRLVFHNWDDAKCVAILKKVREAMVMRPGVSRVLVVEMVVREGRLGSFARNADIRMLTMVNNKERTLDEYREIARKGGFNITDVMTPRGCLSQVLDLRPVG